MLCGGLSMCGGGGGGWGCVCYQGKRKGCGLSWVDGGGCGLYVVVGGMEGRGGGGVWPVCVCNWVGGGGDCLCVPLWEYLCAGTFASEMANLKSYLPSAGLP